MACRALWNGIMPHIILYFSFANAFQHSNRFAGASLSWRLCLCFCWQVPVRPRCWLARYCPDIGKNSKYVIYVHLEEIATWKLRGQLVHRRHEEAAWAMGRGWGWAPCQVSVWPGGWPWASAADWQQDGPSTSHRHPVGRHGALWAVTETSSYTIIHTAYQ